MAQGVVEQAEVVQVRDRHRGALADAFLQQGIQCTVHGAVIADPSELIRERLLLNHAQALQQVATILDPLYHVPQSIDG